MAEGQRDPLIGKVLNGRFEILAPIAAGGMGQIYRAIQRPLDRLVALKVLNPNFDSTKDPHFEERFFLEALTTAKLKHPNTVILHDYGRTDDGLYFMALELVEGRTLQQVLVKEGPMPWPRALYIAAQVARALREAHGLGVVHRDLKPGNIMLVAEGLVGDRVKLLDFGLVKSISLGDAAGDGGGPELTEASVVLGSPLYMAPEQAKKKIDARSDVYSLGAVLYAAMAGRTPFLGKKPIDLMLKHLHEKPPELSTFAVVPPAVNDLVMKCLAKLPEARFQTMDAMLLAMHHALSEERIGLFLTPAHAQAPPVKPVEAPRKVAEAPRQPVVAPPALPALPALPAPPPPPRQYAAPLVPHGSRARRLQRTSRGVFWTIVAGVASTALGAAFVAASKTSQPGLVEASAPPNVMFDSASQPAGATPSQLAEETPGLSLALVLDGDEAAEGGEPVVPVHQQRVRRAYTIPLKPGGQRVLARPLAPKKLPARDRGAYRADPY